MRICIKFWSKGYDDVLVCCEYDNVRCFGLDGMGRDYGSIFRIRFGDGHIEDLQTADIAYIDLLDACQVDVVTSGFAIAGDGGYAEHDIQTIKDAYGFAVAQAGGKNMITVINRDGDDLKAHPFNAQGVAIINLREQKK